MPEIKETQYSSTITLDRLLGEEARIVNEVNIPVNKFVTISFLHVDCSQDFFPEEKGRLFLYPIDDAKYQLHLLYHINKEESEREVCGVKFQPAFFEIFDEQILLNNAPFSFDKTTEQQFSVCFQSDNLLKQVKGFVAVNPLLQSLQLSEIAVQLLRRAVENITVSFTICPVPACRFLAFESEREKIILAKDILEQTIDQPLTIKELSRKIAMNECYLKKGFKTVHGKTINEYQQWLRITKATDLLQQHGQTVTDVASALGYSSISHFSNAFKKATGMKPCELLG